ncbi:hypothetical protein, partial [Streptococcus pneumoniae]|uniref:hypothetical protein n=1 Tax=Streptococcus pneumoniae TaxID=1313 RepID=UPI001E397708
MRTIVLTGNHTVSGNVKIYGGDVDPQGTYAATGQGELMFKALRDVETDNAARNFTTQGGDITFWS